jgi:glycosyltransferase involved in cell wall biosynthesis
VKISFLENYLPINGSVRHIIEMANELVRRGGYEVVIYALDSKCTWLRCNAEIRPQKQVLKDKHDVLIFNKADSAQWRLMEQAQADRKLFYLVGMGDGPKSKAIIKDWLTGKSKHKGRNNTLKRCFRRDDYTVICNGTWMHDFLTGELGFETHIVLSGVNTDMFRPVPEKKAEQPTVMISGDLRPRYETLNIQKAVNQARRKIGKLNLLQYFGKGIPQKQMAAYISQGWLFADAQNRAGWNNPVAEAMACGVPVVCTDIGGNRDFAIHNETALIVPVGDSGAMAKAIVELIQNREKAKRLAKNALERIRGYTWERSVYQLIEVVNEP